MQEFTLLRHLDIDARGSGVGVSHHILDRLDVHALLDHQRSERMPQRVCREFRMRKADAGQSLLHDAADGLAYQSIVASGFVRDEERRGGIPRPVGNVLGKTLHGVGMQHDDLVLLRAAFPLDGQHRFALPLREVPEVDAFHLAGTQSVEQHQREHQPVAPPDDGRRVDRLQQPPGLLGRKRQFAVLRPATAAPDSCGDIVAVTAPLAEAVEEFHNGNEAVHRQETTPFALQVLLVLHDVPPFGRPRIDPGGRQPAEPQGQFAFVVQGRGGQNVALREPLGNYFVQVQCRSHRFSCFKQWA